MSTLLYISIMIYEIINVFFFDEPLEVINKMFEIYNKQHAENVHIYHYFTTIFGLQIEVI